MKLLEMIDAELDNPVNEVHAMALGYIRKTVVDNPLAKE